jgi:hypothetical protein
VLRKLIEPATRKTSERTLRTLIVGVGRGDKHRRAPEGRVQLFRGVCSVRVLGMAPGSLTAVQMEDISAAVKAAWSRNTQRACASVWRHWASWCELHGFHALPAEPRTVAAYLTVPAKEGRSVPTLETARAAIRAAHRDSALEGPTANPVSNWS